MSAFEYATVAVSFILGLAVTYLLGSMVEAFRARRHCRLDWLPFVWAICVLVQQFQFWWALYEVNNMPLISVGVFSTLLFLAGLLFLSGALVLPSGEAKYPANLAEYFTVDGSWGAGALALFNLSAVAANIAIFDVEITETVNVLNLCLSAIATLVALTRARIWMVSLTLAYVAILVFATSEATIPVYESTTG